VRSRRTPTVPYNDPFAARRLAGATRSPFVVTRAICTAIARVVGGHAVEKGRDMQEI
jgi:hypothetical protein